MIRGSRIGRFLTQRFEIILLTEEWRAFGYTKVEVSEITNNMDETLMWLPRIYREVPIGLCCLDTELRYVDINEWLAAINGLSVEEHLGRTISEVIPDVAKGVSAELRQVIETGKPVVDGKVVATTPPQLGRKRIFRHNYLPVKSDDGIIVGVSCCVEEITELERKDADRPRRRSA